MNDRFKGFSKARSAGFEGRMPVISGETPAPPMAPPQPATVYNGPEPFFSPGSPLATQGPASAAGRRWDYPVAQNIHRWRDGVSFEAMRSFADNYALMRLVIETRKDQLESQAWKIGPKNKDKVSDSDSRIDYLTNFFARPDGARRWKAWSRMLAEDMLVIDAATVYLRRTLGGDVYSLEPIDGATIQPLIDDHGRQPLPPNAAYQQRIHGLPAIGYSADEIVQGIRNPRTHRLYGYSPVEQVIDIVETALYRQTFQKQFYTEGTTPDLIFSTPNGWSATQIREFETYWNEMLGGNLAERRRTRFVPEGVKPFNVKEGALKDEMDEWLCRIICYAFKVSSQWGVKQMNRATADNASEQASQEGLEPTKSWLKEMIDEIIERWFGYPDLQFLWVEAEEIGTKEQSEVNDRDLKNGSTTINAVRAKRGEEPVEGGDEPLIYTSSGVMTLKQALALAQKQLDTPAPTIAPGGADQADQPGVPAVPKAPEKDAAEEPIVKAARNPKVSGDRYQPSPVNVAKMASFWGPFLASAGREVAAGAHSSQLAKAAGDDEGDGGDDAEAERKRQERDGAMSALSKLDWRKAETVSREVMEAEARAEAAAAAASIASDLQAGIGVDMEMTNPPASSWARQHAAELVKGIDEVTRRQLAALFDDYFEGKTDTNMLTRRIQALGAFEPDRAELIANTEIANAAHNGELAGWKASADAYGINMQKRWRLSRESHSCPVCIANSEMGWIALDATYPSGHDCPTAHPRCFCWQEARAVGDDGEPL